MPQLDITIIFIEFSFSFYIFWFLYFYNNKFVFPEINRILKIRQVKIVDLKCKEIKLLNLYSLYEKISFLAYSINKNSEIFSVDFLLKSSIKQVILLSLFFQLNLNLFKFKGDYCTLIKRFKYYL